LIEDGRKVGVNGATQLYPHDPPVAAAVHAVSASAAISEPMTFYLAGNGGNFVGCEWVAAQGEIMPETPELFQLYV
jgi:hypothetical protein